MNKKIILIGAITFVVLTLVFAFVLSISREQKNKNDFELLLRAQREGVLSEQGKVVRNELIEPLGGKSGTLLSVTSMEIGYLAPMPPLKEKIMVFIFGTEVEKIEQDAISWLRSRGFSDADLCNLPVVFSVTNPNAQTNKEYKLSMNYIPEFCSRILGSE